MKLFTVLLLSLVGLSAAMPGPDGGLEKRCIDGPDPCSSNSDCCNNDCRLSSDKEYRCNYG
ncbi:hypothetical protein ASPWEDRAFT_182673 [Aspergillus wentii DTO 134E9]|uniref:WAP domain-containing protein n=1 Tax=Aspergillus wentii DTO 134E9 TaxID=1073089 RepID=A0A1L9RSN5_ASPWE|nr:uncharacterized protein ASPWEDRAFT_182673 [Aspergillus wentii DTO 134E9]OJJ37858.1 hypothetical protein ASPWEDRAFT_182673 [Aspergillus wentii DTO 134E9]